MGTIDLNGDGSSDRGQLHDLVAGARATIDNEVDHYLRRVASERESNNQLDDQAADATRLGARDVRRGVS